MDSNLFLFMSVSCAIVLLAAVAAYITPVTRPYVKKYGLYAMIFAFSTILVLTWFFRRRKLPQTDPVFKPPQPMKELVEDALVEVSKIDAGLERDRLEASILNEADVAALADYDANLRRIDKIADAQQKRRELIALVERTKG